jgi:hypothetical protein
MTVRKTLVLLALPAILTSAAAEASGCPPFMCGTDSNGPQLTGMRAASGAAMIARIRPCLTRDCKLATNGPELTGSRAASGPVTVTAARLISGRRSNEVGGSCPPFACGTDGNGPQLNGLAAIRLPFPPPPPTPGPLPLPYPNLVSQ